MIQLPRRSVTRFFIPLIDVMTLLFCIFLLMPIFKKNNPEEPEYKEREKLRKSLQRKQEELAKLQHDLDLQKKRQPLPLQQRLALRVLEIDPGNGKLITLDPGQPPVRRVIDTADKARDLIQQQQRELIRKFPDEALRPELHYLILFPRVESAYPTGAQLRDYLHWFADVSHGLDRPGELR